MSPSLSVSPTGFEEVMDEDERQWSNGGAVHHAREGRRPPRRWSLTFSSINRTDALAVRSLFIECNGPMTPFDFEVPTSSLSGFGTETILVRFGQNELEVQSITANNFSITALVEEVT